MKTYMIFFLILLITLPCISFALFGEMIDKTAEKNPSKIAANKELLQQIRETFPADAQINAYVCCPRHPHLISGHRPTLDFTLVFRLPNFKTTDKEETQKKFFLLLEQTIEILNTSPKIRPYLERFPIVFDKLNVTMILGPENDVEPLIQKPYIWAVDYEYGKMKIIRKSFNKETNTWAKEEETIPFAAEDFFNKATQNSFSQKHTKVDITIPPYPIFNQECLDGAKKWFYFCTQFAKKEGYIYIGNHWYKRRDLTTPDERDKQYYGEMYCSQEKCLTLVEAKLFVRQAFKKHLSFLQNDELAIDQIKRRQAERNLTLDGITQPENLSLRFIFWDKYIDRVQPPYIAEIYTFGKKIYYFTSDECQRLVLLAQEELPNDWDETEETDLKTT